MELIQRDLVKAAVERGVTCMALTNINSTRDVWDFVKYCRAEGIKPLLELKYAMMMSCYTFYLLPIIKGFNGYMSFYQSTCKQRLISLCRLLAYHFLLMLGTGLLSIHWVQRILRICREMNVLDCCPHN